MSIKRGNDLIKQGDLLGAIAEYRDVPEDHPLKKSAEFNIRLAEKRLQVETPKQASVRPLALQAVQSEPKLSIVMPVFNVAPYLDASILSVRYQTYKNFELIIVNDASTDNGMDVVRMHAALDDRIRVINLDHNTLGGAGIPSNIGIDAATGTYLGFVDSDDWVTETAFGDLVRSAERHQADIVIGGFRSFVETNRRHSDAYDLQAFDDLPTDEPFTVESNPSVLTISPVPWRKLYRRDFVERNSIRYPEGDCFYEDNPLHWFALAPASRIVKIDNIISYHRMAREGQTMGAPDYKLAAMCSHVNTVGTYLANRPDLLESQILVDEFYDFLQSKTWAWKRQIRKDVKSIIGKRFFQIATHHRRRLSAAKLPDGFEKLMKELSGGYPDYDLTVVIPAYNCETFIERTIRSVLATPGIRTNVLVIDDGSTDGSAEICRRMADEHANVHFFEQKNRGAGRARNAVIPLCTGRYTFFLDADDEADGRQLAKAVIDATKQGNDLYFVPYKIAFHEKSEVAGMFQSDRSLWDKFATARSNRELRKVAASLINYPWNRIIKTELLHDANIFFGPTVVHNDIAFHWESLLAAENIGFGDQPVCTHVKFEQRAQITNISDHRRLTAFDALEFVHQKITKHANGKDLAPVWVGFAGKLAGWVKDRVPTELMPDYEGRKRRLTDLLDGMREKEALNV